ncbi:hypothetical protein IPM62_00820 [Candidatus Woesebacteria bacterium]|nr:MAG: hypothetical protein IPM62_00820 [Candidatus Woesebacteria bacterium]
MLDTPQGFENLQNVEISPIVQYLITIIFVLAVVLFFFMFLTGGIRWMLSMGNKEKIEAAKGQLKSAFVGLLIVFLSWTVMQFIGQALGVNLLTFSVPGL